MFSEEMKPQGRNMLRETILALIAVAEWPLVQHPASWRSVVAATAEEAMAVASTVAGSAVADMAAAFAAMADITVVIGMGTVTPYGYYGGYGYPYPYAYSGYYSEDDVGGCYLRVMTPYLAHSLRASLQLTPYRTYSAPAGSMPGGVALGEPARLKQMTSHRASTKKRGTVPGL
jgi:hypothetical protein